MSFGRPTHGWMHATPPALLAALICLTSCTDPTQIPQTPSPSASTKPPDVARDGRTVVPSSKVTACEVIGPPEIGEALGARASTLQPGQPSGVQDSAGVTKESCIYPLDQSGNTTNAVVAEVSTYPSAELLAGSYQFELMMDPEDVTGLGDRAKFAMNSLSGTNEYVLAVVSGNKVFRFLIAVPASAPDWDRTSGKAAVESLARKADI